MIPYDKMLHMVAGALVALVFGVVFTSQGIGHVPLLGLFMAFVAGCAKETFDWVVNTWNANHDMPPTHDVDVWDMIATTIGGLVVMSLWAVSIRGI